MSYNVDLSPDGLSVNVRVNVPLTREVALSFTRDAIDLAQRYGVRAILFDVRGHRAVDGMLNQYDYARKLEELGLDPASRIAVLVDPDDDSHDFVETTSRNRGVLLKIFYDEHDVHDWLRQAAVLPGAAPDNGR